MADAHKSDAQMPPLAPDAPRRRAPDGACDAHVHLVAGPHQFPLWESRVEKPASGPSLDRWLPLYRTQLDTFGFTRGIIVHSILYGTDSAGTVEAVKRPGHGFKGVGLLPDDAPEMSLDQFVDWNMAAMRLTYVQGGVLTWNGAKAVAPALAERGLHIQMLAHADRHIEDLADDVRNLPVDIVFDHIEWPADGLTPDGPGFQALCNLVRDGRAWVKLSAVYRIDKAPHVKTDRLLRALFDANPERCLWGSDWPHLMLAGAAMPQAADLLYAFNRAVPDDVTRQRILVDNPAHLFGF